MNHTCTARPGRPLILLALLLLAAGTFARAADDEPRFEHVSPSGVAFTVTADGLSRIARGEQVVAQGGWYAWNAGPGWFAIGEAGLLDLPPHACRQAGAAVREKTLQTTGAGAVRVRHVMAVYSAFYSETDFWAKGHQAWVTEDQWRPRIGLEFLKVVNWLTGPVPIISRAYDIHGAKPEGFESSASFFYRHGLSPMIHDSGLNADAAAGYRKLQEPYVNEDGSLK